MKKVVVYGAGVFGKIFFHDVEKTGALDICAFTMENEFIQENRLF